jgi:hypothetical protein
MFKGRNLLIATKHHKEKIIAPILERELDVNCFVSEHFDTDKLGTFSGEVERTQDPVATAREKCLLSLKANDCDLGIASEGSFGPHPTLFFVPANEEFLILIDLKNNFEVVTREISTATNYNSAEIDSLEELMEFASRTKFPSHALILRKNRNDHKYLVKGITNTEQLQRAFYSIHEKFGKVWVETDMRAMHNPSRMKVIQSATEKLVGKINSHCPKCNLPGFDIREVVAGLPCLACGFPTKSTLKKVYICKGCQFEETIIYPNDKKVEDPMYCDYCNP